MAQMMTSLPSTNQSFFSTGRVGLRRQKSWLNPTRNRGLIEASTATDTHLAKLEKLVGKRDHSTTLKIPKPVKPVNPLANQVVEIGVFESLMARMWSGEPEVEMSPRGQMRLREQLSRDQPEYSPRNHLGPRWREYHGSRDWAGLLDPLDENLRREVVRRGEFVQSAYQGFNSDPAMTPQAVDSERPIVLPDESYRVTKSLYATSSVGLPKWVDDVAPDIGWMTQRSSWVGYVAVCQDEREIARMGRRDIVIALRGTSTCLEWVENFRAQLVAIQNNSDKTTTPKDRRHQAKVECGFQSLFTTPGEHVPSLKESVTQEIKRLLQKYKGETLSISVTGHSLGAALSLLVADEISTCAPNVPPVAVFSFGGPQVGNRAFARRIKNKNVKVLRIVNNQDFITRVPGMFVSEELDQKLRTNPQIMGLIKALDNMPWAYSHVGTELRVDTKMSPYLKPNADVACCHDLEAYLHLVDGFLASNCPFRKNAKRSLSKLLSEQAANVKKLYTSKSKKSLTTLKIERDKAYFTSNSMAPSPSMYNCMPSPS